MRRMDAAVLDDITLPDADGREVRLGDLLAGRRTVIVWLRHFG